MKLSKNILLLTVTLFSFFNATAQKRSNSKKFRLLTYGLPDFARLDARDIIQNKWGIELHGVAGCIVNQELVDSVQKENDSVYKLIEFKYGKGWKEKFDAEIYAEYKIETKIDELVKSFIGNKGIVDLCPGVPFPKRPVGNKGNYLVIVNNNYGEQKLYTLKVNYKLSTIKIVNDYTAAK